MNKFISNYLKRSFLKLFLWSRTHLQDYEANDMLERCASVGTGVGLRMPVVIYHPEGLTLGDKVSIGEFCHIRASGGVTIGNRVLIASHVIITSRGHPIEHPRYGGVLDLPVKIEDDTWIGAGAILLPGAHVRRGSIVAAGAVVTGIVDEMSVFGGIPAKKISEVKDNSLLNV
ncbi:MAG: acyltransferase [Anaerolineales bacterium]|nr:acyltransferase [Anaerolineales bacterium]